MSGISIAAKAAGIKDAQAHSLFAAITETLKTGEKVYIKGFGTFKQVLRKARTITSPQVPNGRVDVPECNAVKFTPTPALKEALNPPKTKGKAKLGMGTGKGGTTPGNTRPAAAEPAPAAAPAKKGAKAKAEPAPAPAKGKAAKPAAAPAKAKKAAPAPEPEVEEEAEEYTDEGDNGEYAEE